MYINSLPQVQLFEPDSKPGLTIMAALALLRRKNKQNALKSA
jgi:hypothetical protein